MTAETGAAPSAQGEDRSIYQKILPWFEDDFGFAKATGATDWRDPTFPANWAELRRAGKPRGAYHFFHPEMSAVAQATPGARPGRTHPDSSADRTRPDSSAGRTNPGARPDPGARRLAAGAA
jgi:Glycosyl hydrolases family 25